MMKLIKLVHMRSGRTLAERVEVAEGMGDRMRGLLGRSDLPPGAGMLIERCSSVHTFFMKFALDVVFLDGNRAVRKVVRNLQPWRLAGAMGADSVLELPAGALDGWQLARGDELAIKEPTCPDTRG